MSHYREIDVSVFARPRSVDAGSAPMLQWLKIEELLIDDRYQRPLQLANRKAIQRIAARFRWSRFSPVFVAPVEAGRYAVIDGQHRIHAAAICGFAEVPCQIVQMDLREQASSFAAINGLVTKVTSWQIFRAALTAGEEWALKLDRIASAAGCKAMKANATASSKQAGEIYPLVKFRQVCAEHDEPVVIRALSVLMAAEGYNDNAEIWDANTLIPLLSAFCRRPKAIADPCFAERLSDFDIWEQVDRIAEFSRQRHRANIPTLSRTQQLMNAVLEWIDDGWPRETAAKALPAPAEASA